MKNIQTIPIDNLGRTVIPKTMRNALGLSAPGFITIELKGTSIILRPKNTVCTLCGNSHNQLYPFNDYFICSHCLQQLKKVGDIDE